MKFYWERRKFLAFVQSPGETKGRGGGKEGVCVLV